MMSFTKICIVLIASSVVLLTACNKTVKQDENQGTKEVVLKKVNIYTTNDSLNYKITNNGTGTFEAFNQPVETQTCVFVYPNQEHQTFMGIGGAITDASAEVFAQLSPEQQQELLTAYFDAEKGIGYTVIRTNMNSCDFSSDSYTYIKEGDNTLQTFDIGHDKKFKIPFIKKAIKKTNGKAHFYFSPWSPPAFMKDNNDMLHGGKLKPEYYQTWADYYVKFIQAYEKEGIPVWGLTIQNEPMAKQIWESCIYTADAERDFLKNYLGPTLHKNSFQDKKIIVWDHNRDLITQRADVILNDPEASKFVWGVGFHWYEDWSGGKPMFENVGIVNQNYPDKNLIFTEGCVESFDSNKYYSWSNAKEYATSMIYDFNNGTVAWTDWNILLDQQGGPNHVGNFCFAPIHADLNTKQIIYTPAYYAIGHFSKFIKPGAKRITTSVSRSSLLSTSFKNHDGSIATIVLNNTNEAIKYYLTINGKACEIEIVPNAIQTLVY